MCTKKRNKNPDSGVRNNYVFSEDDSGRNGLNLSRLSLMLISGLMILAVLMTAGCTGNSAGDISDNTHPDKTNITDVNGSEITGPDNGRKNAAGLSGDVLSGTEWLLNSYSGVSGGLTEVPAGIDATLTFVNDSILGGNSGCNSYSADYSAEEGNLKTGIIVLTEMYCTDATMEFENNYLELLQKGNSIEMSDEKLVISDEDGNVILTFSPFTLRGSSWELTSMNNGMVGVVSLPENIGITLEFSDDEASGNAGCNNYFSSYSTGEDFGIEFSAIGSTKMYCEEDVMVYESSYLKNLELVREYYFNGRYLTLKDSDDKILMTFAESG